MERLARFGLALAISMALGVGSASAQAARWTTVAGGESSGDWVSVDRPVHDGALRGDRTVERLTRTTGYTTGGMTTIVLSGSEAEDARTIRVHLPYGAALDLAQGDAVSVTMSSHRLGLGSIHEVRVLRGTTLVLLSTSAARADGVTIRRGAAIPPTSTSGSRRQFAVDVTIDGHAATLRPSELSFLAAPSLLVSGSDTIYEGVRPPDAFDQRIVTAVRIQPLAPPVATS